LAALICKFRAGEILGVAGVAGPTGHPNWLEVWAGLPDRQGSCAFNGTALGTLTGK